MIHGIIPSLVSLAFPIADLAPDPRNARRHGEQNLQAVVDSYRDHGQRKPLVVQAKADDGQLMVVRAGNGQVEAAKRLGWTHVAIVVVDECDRDAIKFALRDNRTGELAEWDHEVVRGELATFSSDGVDTDALGWSGGDVIELISMAAEQGDAKESEKPKVRKGKATFREVVEDGEPPPLKLSASRAGDVWTMGSHRLVCGDATKLADVQLALNGESAALLWTDPPWNVAVNATDKPSGRSAIKRGQNHTIMNDDLGEDFEPFVQAFADVWRDVLVPGTPIYVAMSAQEWAKVDRIIQATKFHWSSTIIWTKQALVLGRKDYHSQYEPIWYGWRDGAPRKHSVVERTISDVWPVDRPRKSEQHPTMKPLRLIAQAVDASTEVGDLVLDTFGGSGSTMLACEQLGRRAALVELDPRYCDVIVERWQSFTGRKATRTRGAS